LSASRAIVVMMVAVQEVMIGELKTPQRTCQEQVLAALARAV
jgi:hypothetical protein